MENEAQAQLAERFRAMHRPPLLFLPNAWDAMSARAFAAAGFEAVATSSAGMAWALGYPDGERAPWTRVLQAVGEIVRAAGLAVTADIEGGYGETPEAVASHVAEVIAAGAVGVNLEDGVRAGPSPIRELGDGVERIRAARAAARRVGVPLVINARTDVFLRQVGEASGRFDEAVKRCAAYLAAGADCVFPIGLRDAETIGRFVKAVGGPVNVAAHAGMPGRKELERLGVARVSTASGPALVALAATQKLARGLRASDDFESLRSELTYAEAQALFTP